MRRIKCNGKGVKKGKVKGIQCYQCKACGCFFKVAIPRALNISE